MRNRTACLLLFLCLSFHRANSQNARDKIAPLASNYLRAVDGKMSRFNRQIETYSRNALDKMIKTERRMREKVAAVDPSYSGKLFPYAIDSLQKLKSALSAGRAGRLINRNYFAYSDTLRQALVFLKNRSGIGGQTGAMSDGLSSSLQQLDVLEGRLNTIATIRYFLEQRLQVLNGVVARFPQCLGRLRELNKAAYYYSAQIAQYKSALKDPAAIETRMLQLVGRSPAFQNLMQTHGQLAGLFAPRASLTSLPLSTSTAVSGLPTRAMVQEYIRKNMPLFSDTTDVAAQLQSKFTAAGTQLHESGGSPDQAAGQLPVAGLAGNAVQPAFTPNSQRTKPFGRRIEWSVDVQFGKAFSYLPATANIGVKAGYRLNDRLIAGIGADYVMGMGMGWKDIHFNSQGIGLRAYGKWLITKGWNVQGGAELNYMTAFRSISQLRNLPNWQTSALLGISKQYRLSRKMNGNFQVLYDFLYRQHLPNTQPLLFRLGYDLK